MKKIINLALLAVLLLAFSACNESDDPKHTYTFQEISYNHGFKDGKPSMRRTTTSFTIDNVDNLIDIVMNVYPDGVTEVAVHTDFMELKSLGNATYSFQRSSMQAGGHTISDISGYLDVATSFLYVTYRIDGGPVCYSTSRLLFPYCSTVVTDLSDNPVQPLLLDNSMYGFVTNDLSGKAVFAIINFQINALDSPITELDFNNVDLTVTEKGYTLKAENVLPSAGYADSEKYPISDLDVTIDLEAKTINGLYKCNQKQVTFSGKLFSAL